MIYLRLLATFCFCLSFTLIKAQDDKKTWKKACKIVSKLSTEEKIGQTCQLTLDALLKFDGKGQLITPIILDEKKVKELVEDAKIGSVLNVSTHTLTLEQWHTILNKLHENFNQGKTNVPIIYGVDAIHGANYVVGGTLFPQEIGLAATWEPSYANRMGEITAYETRASGVPWNFSPVLDLGRQPLWSRYFETLGEDPFLAATMGAELVKGYQGNSLKDSTRVLACMKHFVGYSLPRSGRDRTPAWIPERLMKELYLPSFKAAVDAGALSVMVNSGDVNGTPGHINKKLLTELLKKEWGFKGFAVSDWKDIIMLHTVHKVAKSRKEAIAMSINAGLDMSMVPEYKDGKEYLKLFQEAMDEKLISKKRLNDAVTRIVYTKLKLGLFENPIYDLDSYTEFASKEHKKSALNAAEESITLLKNEDVLPLSMKEKILIVGDAANNLRYQNGAWTHTWQGQEDKYNTKNCSTVRQVFENKRGKNAAFVKGYEIKEVGGWETTISSKDSNMDSLVNWADKIVVCLGELPSTEKPGDIHSLNIDDVQKEIVLKLQKSGKPVVLVLMFGKPRIVRELVDGSEAILQAYLPGDYGAEALYNILYGNVNPSGKLPYTYPKYDGVIEYYDYVNSEKQTNKSLYPAIDPQWKFGEGLSYTNFTYSDMELSTESVSLKGGEILATVKVTNTGPIKGKEIVQWYIEDEYATITPANKKLKGFEKIELNPGESKQVSYLIKLEDLGFYNQDAEWTMETGSFNLHVSNLKKSFRLE